MKIHYNVSENHKHYSLKVKKETETCYSMTYLTSTAPNSNTELTLSDNKDFVIYLLIDRMYLFIF